MSSVAFRHFGRIPIRQPKDFEKMPDQALQQWGDEVAALTTPDNVHWCDGTDEAVSYTHLTLPTSDLV